MTIVTLDQGIGLLSGGLFDYSDPGGSVVTINDIAEALSKICRFSGHIREFYSVAQHLVNASHLVAPEHAFTALMHDTAEAFTNDIPTPVKHAIPALKELENRIEQAMSGKFGFAFPLPAEVKYADLQMLALEKEALKGDFSEWSVLQGVEIESVRHRVWLDPWTPEQACDAFLDRYYQLKRDRT